MDDFKPQYSKSLVKQIIDYLTNEILQGRIRAGQRLVESELQRSFGISRSPIREAFRVLEQEGLLVSVPRKGAYVREITVQEIRDNFPVRAYLEGLAAKFATSHLTETNIKDMRSALSEMEQAGMENDFRTYFMAHDRFHKVFINISNNRVLMEVVKNLRKHSMWYRFSYKWHQQNYKRAISCHNTILDLFQKGDADAVEIMVRTHILENQKRFVEFLESNGKESEHHQLKQAVDS